jgi:rhamnogalacturonan endolyase
MKSLFYKTLMRFLLWVLAVSPAYTYAQNVKWKLLCADNFNKLDRKLWVAEIAPLPDSKVFVKKGELVLDTQGGVTLWLNKKLKGNIQIEFDRTVLLDSGKNDRLSDLNVFWMATDPRNKNLFTRNGVLESYDSLLLYYVGMGGNSNSTTRFRRYDGKGDRKLLQEYSDRKYLLEPNRKYHITITIKGSTTTFEVDGKTFFSYNDPDVLREGYFGFRSTKSRQMIDNVRVYQLR